MIRSTGFAKGKLGKSVQDLLNVRGLGKLMSPFIEKWQFPEGGLGTRGMNQEHLMGPESRKHSKHGKGLSKGCRSQQNISNGHGWGDLGTKISNRSDG